MQRPAPAAARRRDSVEPLLLAAVPTVGPAFAWSAGEQGRRIWPFAVVWLGGPNRTTIEPLANASRSDERHIAAGHSCDCRYVIVGAKGYPENIFGRRTPGPSLSERAASRTRDAAGAGRLGLRRNRQAFALSIECWRRLLRSDVQTATMSRKQYRL